MRSLKKTHRKSPTVISKTNSNAVTSMRTVFPPKLSSNFIFFQDHCKKKWEKCLKNGHQIFGAIEDENSVLEDPFPKEAALIL